MFKTLNQISLFQELTSEAQLKLQSVCTEVTINAHETLFCQGEPANEFYIVLEGSIQISKKIDNREIAIDSYGDDTFFGEVPIIAGTDHSASAMAIRQTHLSVFPEKDFWQMLLSFPSVRKKVLGHLAIRSQELQMLSQHHEKLIGLGTLAAGLAHELNNPASAAYGAVIQFKELIPSLYALISKHLEQYLAPGQIKNLLEIKDEAANNIVTAKLASLDPLAQIDLEDKLTLYLEEQGIDDGWKYTPILVAGGVDVQKLAFLEAGLGAGALKYILTCLELTLAQTSLLTTLEESTRRISQIVSAVKSYSYVDRAPSKKETVDIHEGLNNTITILNYKLKRRNLLLVRNYEDTLPLIEANGSSLNQVWTNLIDNAIDALTEQENGIITLSTSIESNHVVVEIVDNGPGIPPEIKSQIFDPFFTTKEIGTGTGIGLDLVYRIIVAEHQGCVSCFSEPGNTTFQVKLPIQSLAPEPLQSSNSR